MSMPPGFYFEYRWDRHLALIRRAHTDEDGVEWPEEEVAVTFQPVRMSQGDLLGLIVWHQINRTQYGLGGAEVGRFRAKKRYGGKQTGRRRLKLNHEIWFSLSVTYVQVVSISNFEKQIWWNGQNPYIRFFPDGSVE